MDARSLVNWGALVIGLAFYGYGWLWTAFFHRTRRKDASSETGGAGMTAPAVLTWVVSVPVVIGALLFFLTGLDENGIPLWLGTTFGISGAFLLVTALLRSAFFSFARKAREKHKS